MSFDPESSPTSLLRTEHELILKVTDALGRALGAGEPDLEVVERCLIFFRLYVDAHHHGKEEDLLFPALGEQGVPMGDGPVGMMLEEHMEGRTLIASMRGALAGAREGDAGARASLETAGQDYAQMITDHIDKENNILFDMADSMIEGPELVELTRAYEELATRDLDGYSIADLEALAEKILVSVD